MKIIRFLTALLLALLVAPVFATAVGGDPFVWVGGLMAANFIPMPQGVLAFSASLLDIGKPLTANAGAGGGLNNEVIIFLEDDVQTFPPRGADSVTIATDFVMKAGKYMRVLYSTPETIEPIQKKIKGDNIDITAWEVGLNFFHPGLEASILQFMAEHSGSKFHFILRNCAADKMYYLGEKCNPILMDEAESKWGKKVEEGKGTTFNFLGHQSMPYAIYTGLLTLEAAASGAPAPPASGSPVV